MQYKQIVPEVTSGIIIYPRSLLRSTTHPQLASDGIQHTTHALLGQDVKGLLL